MIQIKDLVVEIRRDELLGRRVRILKGISLHIRANEIFAIIGPNGAGKSTLLKNILGFYKSASGSTAIAQGKTLGFLPENPYYYDYLTLHELLWFSARSFSIPKPVFANNLQEVIDKVDMRAHLHKRLRGFSKGMIQRAGIAAAIIHDPDLVILDEPMSGLDPLGRKMVFALIKELKKKGKTILFCSHILNDVERLCDRVAIMNKGKIIKLLNREDLMLSQKETIIVLKAGARTRQALTSAGYQFKITEEHASVYVNAAELNQALRCISENRLEVETIKGSEATLENIFYQITNHGENDVAGNSHNLS